MKKTTDFSFSRFFNPGKSPQPRVMGKAPKRNKKLRNFLVWNSKKRGPYLRSVNGRIRDLKVSL